MKDYYSILEIKQNSNFIDIKNGYHRLILKWHPDKNNNYYESTKIFRDIQEAYQVLRNKEEKIEYDNKLNISPFSHEKNIEDIVFERLKIEMIIKVRKELIIKPEINMYELEKNNSSYKNFEKEINNYDNKELCLIFSEKLLKDIKKERIKKIKEFNLLITKEKEISIIEKRILEINISNLEIDIDEGLAIFSNKCSCYLSNDYINIYKKHILKCIFIEKDVENFSSELVKLFENKIKKIRLAIINEIEEEITKFKYKTNKKFITFSDDLINWKEKIYKSDRKACFLIRDCVIKEINKNLEENKYDNYEHTIKTLTPKQIQNIIKILKINENDINFNKLKLEIIKLKKENLKYKKMDIKKQIFYKREKLNKLKQKLCEEDNINNKQKNVLNKFLFISQKNYIMGIDYKNLYKKNINELEKKVSKENINGIINIQLEIIEMEKKLFDILEDEKLLIN